MTSRLGTKGCFVCGLLAAAGFLVFAVGFTVYSLRVPEDSPMARMYRTQADLTVLVKAVETYHSTHGAYPPGGLQGLAMATRELSRRADYLPAGPPADGWGRPYHYVPHGEYDSPGSGAMSENGKYRAPDSFQIYSVGADGVAGLDGDGREDNISSYDPERKWLNAYREMQAMYRGRGVRQP